jgi:adenylate cyclase
MKPLKILYGIAFVFVIFFSIYKSDILDYSDFKIYDILFNVSRIKHPSYSSPVVVVDIDEKSLKYLGQWPWSRIILSKLIEDISLAKPANIGLDIIFPEKDKTSILEIEGFFKKYFSKNLKIIGLEPYLRDNDKIFAKTISKEQITMSVYLTNKETSSCFIPKKSRLSFAKEIDTSFESSNMLCNLDILQKSASDIGFINVSTDRDGILRRVAMLIKYKRYYIPSFALANLINIDNLHAEKNSISILGHTFKADKSSDILLNFHDKSWYQSISALDVLTDKFDKKMLLGKFVIIGTSAVGLHDNYTINSGETIPGAFVHATVIDNILNDTIIRQPIYLKTLNFLFAAILSLFLLFFIYKKDYFKVLALFVGASSIYVLVGFYLLKNFIYISLGYFLAPYFIFFFLANMIFVIFYHKEKKQFLEEITKAHSDTIDSMALIVETRDAETGAHIIRTKEYMRSLIEHLSQKEPYKKRFALKNYKELLYRATPLHDIGKVGIPDYILKKNGRLNAQEYEIMKEHSRIGKEIIENAMKNNKTNLFLKIAYNIAYYHHEKWDGSGYPCRIKGEDIPLEARMMALVDVYDALTSKRCYKISFDFKESEDIIIRGKGTHFDPDLIDAFIELKEKFRDIAKSIK